MSSMRLEPFFGGRTMENLRLQLFTAKQSLESYNDTCELEWANWEPTESHGWSLIFDDINDIHTLSYTEKHFRYLINIWQLFDTYTDISFNYIYIYALHTCHRTFTQSLLLWWANESICCGKGQSMFAQSYFPLRFDSTLITMKPTLPVWFGSVSPLVSKLFDLQSLEWDGLI